MGLSFLIVFQTHTQRRRNPTQNCWLYVPDAAVGFLILKFFCGHIKKVNNRITVYILS